VFELDCLAVLKYKTRKLQEVVVVGGGETGDDGGSGDEEEAQNHMHHHDGQGKKTKPFLHSLLKMITGRRSFATTTSTTTTATPSTNTRLLAKSVKRVDTTFSDDVVWLQRLRDAGFSQEKKTIWVSVYIVTEEDAVAVVIGRGGCSGCLQVVVVVVVVAVVAGVMPDKYREMRVTI